MGWELVVKSLEQMRNRAARPAATVRGMDMGSTRARMESKRTPLSAYTSELYRLHGFRVIDVEGVPVGEIDWVWTDDVSKQAEFIGIRLRWIAGTARPIPAIDALMDVTSRTIEVPYTARQIRRAGRLKIDRMLSLRDKRRVCFHYRVDPHVVPSLGRGAEYASVA
jgi:hypothetical protein